MDKEVEGKLPIRIPELSKDFTGSVGILSAKAHLAHAGKKMLANRSMLGVGALAWAS